MNTVWLSERLLRRLGAKGHAALAEAVEHVNRTPPPINRSSLDFEVSGRRFRAASILSGVTGIFDVSPAADGAPQEKWRDVIFPGDVIEEFVTDRDWESLFRRVLDVANIDSARERAGLKYLREKSIHSVFAPGDYHRIHFLAETPGFAAVLGLFDARPWATHAGSASIRQPPEQQVSGYRKLQEAALGMRERLEPLDRPRITETPPPEVPLRDGWLPLNRLRELGITDQALMRQVLDMRIEDDLIGLMDHLTEGQYEAVERAFQRKLIAEARRREQRLTTLEVYQMSATGRSTSLGHSFESALAMLTPQQASVVKMERDAPIRLQGGPGTGKTFTAVMRAGYVARRAEEQGLRARIGFLVFNPDLGVKVLEQVSGLGLDRFLAPSHPQHIAITSLHEWCARFVKVDELGIEPLAPYRAEKGDADRHAALRLAVDEARRRLTGGEYESLWSQFDARSKNGLWEIETEISQFIKARDIADLTTYLSERRPAGWWLAAAEKPFKRFVWEIATIYNETLRSLDYVDSDDLTNDAIKEVSKTVWQQYRKPEDGFDYLILDEAQDFFRNQLTLLRHLVKRPEGMMMCFDQAQAVYSRYPSLRDIGFDTDVRFQGTRLEQNFRSTRQIVAALHQLITAYPTLGLIDNWGAFQTGSEGNNGERPSVSGFAGEQAMLAQVRDLVRSYLDGGGKPRDVGVIGFDDALLERVGTFLVAAGIQHHRPEGEGRRTPQKAITVSSARQIKGQQFDFCIVVGADRDRMPDFSSVKSELHRETRREDDLRLFLVALSRCRRSLHVLWAGTEPSEFILAMGDAVDRRG